MMDADLRGAVLQKKNLQEHLRVHGIEPAVNLLAARGAVTVRAAVYRCPYCPSGARDARSEVDPDAKVGSWNWQAAGIIATGVVALVGFLATYLNNRLLEQRRANIAFVSNQLEKLYGPLLALTESTGREHPELLLYTFDHI
jgi:hypothetical protein